MKIRAACLVWIYFVAAFAGATPSEARFGPEFTFTSTGRAEDVPAMFQSYLEQLRRHLVEGQPDGAKFKVANPLEKFRTFVSPNGWEFTVTTDPGVIEVKMAPMTVSEYRKFESDIQDAIFVSAANVGLFPWDYLGGGHINLDLEIFGQDIRLARNFLVDYLNHNELAMGVFNYDFTNATPPAMIANANQDSLRHLVQQADAGTFDHPNGVYRFFMRMREILGNAHRRYGLSYAVMSRHALYFKGNRIEMRAVRPQKDVSTWIRQIALIEGRLNYLRTLQHAIPFRLEVPLRISGDPVDRFLEIGDNPPVYPQEALRAFHRFVVESGQKWQDHRDYLWPNWVRSGEVQKYERSKTFQKLLCQENLR